MWSLIVLASLALSFDPSESAGAGAARLLCYLDDVKLDSFSDCTHVVYTGVDRGSKLDAALKEFKKLNPRIKVLLRVNADDENLTALTKSKYVQGLEIYNAHNTLNRTKVQETLESARTAIAKAGGGPLFISLPGHPELLAKYYDLRSLVKVVDLMVLETHDLGKMKKVTYHPSRLSGLWDMMNTDSVVDLAIGLGVPASKLVISLPAGAFQFTLQNQTLSTPGSPAVGDVPLEIDQAELCRQLRDGRWMLERDQDLSAPYAFRNTTWISFEDSSSIDVKGKYARVRGLAGLALQQAGEDVETPCGPTLRHALGKVLNQQSRAPRAAVLRSLENEILAAPTHARPLDALQLSPYRITQVVDSDGVIHSIREDTRTEFSCTRQGYFVHPRSCGRFYRCVKFDQLSPDYTVFEFDCPTGLAFDSRYEVCVWPGSLPLASACAGSSEIAPVPRTRFLCPDAEGYYADPENCRWFFACLDHGTAPLSAYEFRCPFGLGFDSARLTCDWPWLVPACGNVGRYEAEAFGLSHAALSDASGFHGLSADAVNVAAHQSLASGASLTNHVGIQGGFLTHEDALDRNFIASQDIANLNHGQLGFNNFGQANAYALEGGDGFSLAVNGLGHQGLGFVQPADYEKQYTSGSLLLDDYRLPTKGKHLANANLGQLAGTNYNSANIHNHLNNAQYVTNVHSNADNSGAYVHDPSGDYAEPYKHVHFPIEPYIHDADKYRQEYQDYGLYTDNEGKYIDDNSGRYIQSNGGQYKDEIKSFNDYGNTYKDSYKIDNSGKYNANAYAFDLGKYVAGINDNTGLYTSVGGQNIQYNGNYGSSNKQEYITSDKVYTGASHALTAGAINVDLVGKTTFVDNSGHNYNSGYNVQHQTGLNQHNYVVPQPAVAISHLGTDSGNYDGYEYATTPTSSGVPTTAAPFASTTSLPTLTTYVPVPPKTSATELFGYSQPSVTYVQQTVVPVTPKTQYSSHNNEEQASFVSASYNQEVAAKSESSGYGYEYRKPSIKFEEGISYTTATPIQVSTFKPAGFSHNTVHESVSNGYEYLTPVHEEPFKKVVAYTTGPSQPTESTLSSESYSHQTVHNYANEAVNTNNYHENGYVYEQPKTVVTYTTQQPSYVSTTPQPQVFNHETVHTVNAINVNKYSEDAGYVYNKPEIKFEDAPRQIVQVSTEKPIEIAPQYQSFTQQTIHKTENKNYGYDYPRPTYEPVVHVSTIQPPVIVPEYKSQSQHVIHQTETQDGYHYAKPVNYNYVETQQPQTQYSTVHVPVEQPKQSSFSQQTVHLHSQNTDYGTHNNVQYIENPKEVVKINIEHPKTIQDYNIYEQQAVYNTETQNNGYEYPQPNIQLQEIANANRFEVNHQTVHTGAQNAGFENVQYTEYPKPTAQVTNIQHQINALEHKLNNEQTLYNTESKDYGYEYTKPNIQLVETPKPTQYVQVSTIQPPVVVPEYKSYKTEHQISHVYQPIPSTPAPEVIYPKQAVTVYENPLTKYTQHQTTYVQPAKAVYTETYPIEHKTYVQHEHQNLFIHNQPEIQTNVETVSTANSYVEAHEVSHKVIHPSGSNTQYVSSTPASVSYENNHYVEYESPKVYQAQAPVKQETIIHQTPDAYDYKGVEYTQQYELAHNSLAGQQISFTTKHTLPQKVESFHVSSYPSSTTAPLSYHSPEIQIADKYEEILPSDKPDYSSNGYQVSTSHTYSSTPTYLPPKTENTYLPPSSTPNPVVKINFQTPKYLPPASYVPSSTTAEPIVNYEYTAKDYLPPKVENEYLPPSTTVKPAVSEYTTREYLPPTVQSTYLPPTTTVKYTTRDYLPPKTENTYLPPSTTYKPKPSSTARTTTYKYVEPTTDYKAPEYLPPDDELDSHVVNFESYGLRNNEYASDTKIKYNPYNENVQSSTVSSSTRLPTERKHNIVVETAKSNLLGFGTVGPDAGLVREYSSTTPSYSSESYSVTPDSISSTTYATNQVSEEPRIPARRVKPKVAVVTKINDFNPFLVRKLGAVCSCQQPIVVLRGGRPSAKAQDYDDDYDYSERGDIEVVKLQRLRAPNKGSVTTVTTTTFNPIIVPDDSYYQDYEEANESLRTKVSDNYVSSTTEKVVQIRPRTRTTTVAPTYESVLLDGSTAAPIESESPKFIARVDQSFDRYGSGGVRSRDETLQGTIDCQRAGLFRHPKQCNKFYACRWDKTKHRFTLHVFNCPVQLSFDPNLGACNWPSQGPSCQGDTLITNNV